MCRPEDLRKTRLWEMLPSHIHHQVTWGQVVLTTFWDVELVSQSLMTVSFLARLSKLRPRFSQLCPCSSFLFKVFFRLLGYFSCFFRALERSQKHVSLCDVWSSPSHLPLEPMVLCKPFWCWHQHFLINLVHTN